MRAAHVGAHTFPLKLRGRVAESHADFSFVRTPRDNQNIVSGDGNGGLLGFQFRACRYLFLPG